MGHEYTHEFRDFDALHRVYETIRHVCPNPGQPSIDLDRAFQVQSEGVPLRGGFTCRFEDVVRRLHYNNHAPLNDALDDVRKKLGKEEAKSYHIVFPKSVAYFIDGLFIAFMNWVIQKGKGRIVVDPTTHLDEHDTGALNDQIPKPGWSTIGDESPAITYSNMLARHLTHLWNLRITFPTKEILQHMDDTEGAFHWIPYHLDLGACFAYGFCEFLVIPIGMIFGAGDSPGWFGLMAEPRSHLAAVGNFATMDLPLADNIILPPPPSADEIRSFVQAVPDSLHPSIPSHFMERHWHAMFVDDSLTAAIWSLIHDAIRASVGSAFQNYGYSDYDRRGPVIAEDKFDYNVSARIPALGMIIDSRLMAMAWPLDKLRRLRLILDDWVGSPRKRSAHEAAVLLGLARHGAPLSAMGIFWSISLQRQLSGVMKRAGNAAMQKKRWWRFQRLSFDKSILRDLDMMRRTLPHPSEADPDPFHFWWWPIGLLIPRECNAVAISDASYGGMGGWSATWSFMWRLTREDLVMACFDMRLIDDTGEDLQQFARGFPDAERGLHINVLELISIIINTWLVLYHMRRHEPPPGGWIVNILTDNSSALSWFHFATRYQRSPVVANLTILCQALIAFSHADCISCFQGEHLPGTSNGPADALSRPLNYPSVASTTEAFSQLQICRFSRLPFALLSRLARIASSTSTVVRLVNETTTLLTLEPRFLPVGSMVMASVKNFWRRSTGRRLRRRLERLLTTFSSQAAVNKDLT